MKKTGISIAILLTALLFVHTESRSQTAPDIEWQNTIGGSGSDVLRRSSTTSDGGVICIGYSSSNASGDKSQNSKGGQDFWIVKLDSLGSIEWEKTYGGSGTDNGYGILQTNDGGYICGGISDSGVSGDKTVASNGADDFWVLKLNSSGTIEWQKSIGGSGGDGLVKMAITSEGNYICIGNSNSNISGDKSENNIGGTDYWVVKLDSFGNVIWDNTIGGSGVDAAKAIIEDINGDYIVGGWSSSPASGDKSEANIGQPDYWIVKIDSSGAIIWEETIGGTLTDTFESLSVGSDGNYLCGGHSISDISGDKSDNSFGGQDYWIISLDTAGAIQWQETIGGTDTDYLYSFYETADGGYICAGSSNSGLNGNKTVGNQGLFDYWLVKLDRYRTSIWQKIIGGSNHEDGGYLTNNNKGGYFISGWSRSDISFDKTENSNGGPDYWVLNLDEDPSTISTLPNYLPSNGLIGWWPFNGNAYDESGNGHHGTPNGAFLTSDRDGNSNSAYSFDGTDDEIRVPHATDLNLTGDFSISAWFYSTNPPIVNNAHTIIGKRDDGGSCCSPNVPYHLSITYQQNGIDFKKPILATANSGSYSYSQASDTVLIDTWQHLVVTYSNDSAKMYLDGVLIHTDYFPPSNRNTNTSDLLFGSVNRATGDEYFEGYLDDIGLWNRALTDTEIDLIYTSYCNKPDFVSLGTERTTALCPNDSVKIFVVNPQGPGLTYQWYKSDAIIPGAVDSFYYASEVRKYKVRVSSGPGCFRTSGRIQPTVAIPPSVSITPQGSTDICAGDSVLLVANYNPGYSYQWRRYGVDIPGATDTMYYASQPGNYKIFITNDGGCISKSSNVSVNIVCRLAGSAINSDVEVMPNPTSDNFSVKLNDLGEEIPVSVEFIDQQGRLIESRRVNGQSLIEFSASGLSNGNYTVIVRFESGETVEKVVSVVR